LSERLLLIDGFSLIHRAYHALPPLSTAEGQPTNAVLGLAQMVLNLLESEQPAAVAVALDPPGPTFRHELTETYKANRKEMDEALAAQIEPAKELLTALGLPTVEVAGFEADLLPSPATAETVPRTALRPAHRESRPARRVQSLVRPHQPASRPSPAR
jgi:DNA polymerase-1